MQATFKIRRRLPSTISCGLQCSPQVSSVLGSLEARVQMRLLIHEPMESRVATLIALSVLEARELGARLIAAADDAKRMLDAEAASS